MASRGKQKKIDVALSVHEYLEGLQRDADLNFRVGLFVSLSQGAAVVACSPFPARQFSSRRSQNANAELFTLDDAWQQAVQHAELLRSTLVGGFRVGGLFFSVNRPEGPTRSELTNLSLLADLVKVKTQIIVTPRSISPPLNALRAPLLDIAVLQASFPVAFSVCLTAAEAEDPTLAYPRIVQQVRRWVASLAASFSSHSFSLTVGNGPLPLDARLSGGLLHSTDASGFVSCALWSARRVRNTWQDGPEVASSAVRQIGGSVACYAVARVDRSTGQQIVDTLFEDLEHTLVHRLVRLAAAESLAVARFCFRTSGGLVMSVFGPPRARDQIEDANNFLAQLFTDHEHVVARSAYAIDEAPQLLTSQPPQQAHSQQPPSTKHAPTLSETSVHDFPLWLRLLIVICAFSSTLLIARLFAEYFEPDEEGFPSQLT